VAEHEPQHPKHAKLVELAREHGWHVERTELGEVRGGRHAYGLSFTADLPSGRAFSWLLRFAVRESSGRWVTMEPLLNYRVQGALLPGDGSPRDECARLWGSALETRYWPSLRGLEWNLAHPEHLAKLDWVGEAPGIPREGEVASGQAGV